MKFKDYRLCYAWDGVLYFTDNFEHQWGDDWNDSLFSSEAPYEVAFDEPASKDDNSGHIFRMFVDTECSNNISFAGDTVGDFGYYSVENINKGAAPWVTLSKWDHENKRYVNDFLLGGMTVSQVCDKLDANNTKYGFLTFKADRSLLEKETP